MSPLHGIEVSEDTLLSGSVRLLQPKRGYRAGIDPVLLAAAVNTIPGQRVLDMGCGAGAAVLCLMRRCPGLSGFGLEKQSIYADLAYENAKLNNLLFRVCLGDVADGPAVFRQEDFDHVICNPPYLRDEGSRSSTIERRAIATQERGVGLDIWVSAAMQALKPRGTLTMIHRSDRIGDLIKELHGKASLKLYPLWPREGVAAKRLIVSARKDDASPLQLLSGLILHEDDGRFTQEAERVLCGARALTNKCLIRNHRIYQSPMPFPVSQSSP